MHKGCGKAPATAGAGLLPAHWLTRSAFTAYLLIKPVTHVQVVAWPLLLQPVRQLPLRVGVSRRRQRCTLVWHAQRPTFIVPHSSRLARKDGCRAHRHGTAGAALGLHTLGRAGRSQRQQQHRQQQR